MNLSHLAQVRRLTEVAEAALAQYPLRGARMHFIQHGENTTFRVEAGKRRYLLRVHRAGYHSPEALHEELAWLRRLARVEGLAVPKPVRTVNGKSHAVVATIRLPEPRWCALLEWVDGTFLGKRMPEKRIHQLGSLMATLHEHARGQPCRHRRYWTAGGLLGKDPKFGRIDALTGISRRDQSRIDAGRRITLARLRAFEQKFPARRSLIHADLHFGNFVVQGDRLGAIDFDDCGLGLHAYDLAVPLSQLENMFLEDWGKFLALYDSIQEGYALRGRWDSHDEAILPALITARRLVMIGWLESRSANPKFRKILAGSVERALAHFERFGTLR